MGTNQSRSLDEQSHTFIGKQGVRGDVVALARHRERRNSVGQLSRDAEALAAGDQHGDTRTATNDLSDQAHASLEQVLDVVENQQQLSRSEVLAERLDQGLRWQLLDL